MKTLPKSILIWGVSLWLIGLIVTLFIPIEYNYFNFYKLDDLAFSSNLLMFLFVVAIAPLIEELIFRYGLIFNKVYIYYSIVVLAVLLLNWRFFMIFVILATIVFYLKINESLKLIFVGSLAFAIIHLNNFYQINGFILFYLIFLFGMSLVMSYLRIKKGILFSIGLHALYNFLILYANYVGSPKNLSYENQEIKVDINRTDFFSSEYPILTLDNNSIVFKSKRVKDILESLSKQNSNEFHYYPQSILYDGNVLFKNEIIEPLNPQFLGYDTTNTIKRTLGYSIKIGNPIIAKSEKINNDEEFIHKVQSQNTSGLKNTFKGVINRLSNDFKVPIEFENLDHHILNDSEHHFILYKKEKSFEENIALLSMQIGYEITIQEKEIPCSIVLYKTK